MPAPKTNLIPYSCFAYYDETFDECKKCKHNIPCKKATDSNEYEEVRKIFKFKSSQIQELVKEWSK